MLINHSLNNRSYFNLKWLLILITVIIPLSSQANSNTILVLGDSLSAAYRMQQEQGWVALLSKELETSHPNWKVINYSQTGETTGGGRQRIKKILSDHKPDITIIELGGNDGLRGLPPLLISKNLEAMIKLSLQSGSKILLIGMKLPPNYSDKYTQQFEAIYKNLSEKYEVPLVPFLLENVALNDDLMMADRVHPTAKAQPILVENVLPTLLNLLETQEQNK